MPRVSTATSLRVVVIAFTLLSSASDRLSMVDAAPPGNRPQRSPPRRRHRSLATGRLPPLPRSANQLSCFAHEHRRRGPRDGQDRQSARCRGHQYPVLVQESGADLRIRFRRHADPDRLDPDAHGQRHRADFSIMDGQFEMSGNGTKGNTLSALVAAARRGRRDGAERLLAAHNRRSRA